MDAPTSGGTKVDVTIAFRSSLQSDLTISNVSSVFADYEVVDKVSPEHAVVTLCKDGEKDSSELVLRAGETVVHRTTLTSRTVVDPTDLVCTQVSADIKGPAVIPLYW